MAQVYALKYLAKAAVSAPRDLVNSYVARHRPIHPTVLIFHCTFVCDARCEMCRNWKRGDRKTRHVARRDRQGSSASGLWKNIENANVSGGEPTTRNDLVEICRVMLDRLPRLRKFGINTTGLTPHRGIPMLTKIVEMCHERGHHLQHARVDRRRRRHAQPGAAGEARLREGERDHPRDEGAAEEAQLQLRHLDDASST